MANTPLVRFGGAALEYSQNFAAGETIAFTWAPTMSGSLSDYALEYVITTTCGSEVVRLTDTSGLTINSGQVPVDAGELDPGEYVHAMRLTHRTTGDKVVPFTGRITVVDGPFA